jgi:hypothetical protein
MSIYRYHDPNYDIICSSISYDLDMSNWYHTWYQIYYHIDYCDFHRPFRCVRLPGAALPVWLRHLCVALRLGKIWGRPHHCHVITPDTAVEARCCVTNCAVGNVAWARPGVGHTQSKTSFSSSPCQVCLLERVAVCTHWNHLWHHTWNCVIYDFMSSLYNIKVIDIIDSWCMISRMISQVWFHAIFDVISWTYDLISHRFCRFKTMM